MKVKDLRNADIQIFLQTSSTTCVTEKFASSPGVSVILFPDRSIVLELDAAGCYPRAELRIFYSKGQMSGKHLYITVS